MAGSSTSVRISSNLHSSECHDANKFFAVYVILCWSYFPIVFCLYPETARRTLEDMDEIFIQNPSIFVFGKSDMTQRKRPQAFMDAEERRIAAAEAEGLGDGILSEKAATRTSQVERV